MIKIGIVGYGNLGRGVECAVLHSQDMELTGVLQEEILNQVKHIVMYLFIVWIKFMI